MNRNYETVFILNPVLSEKQLENTVKKYQKQLEKNKVNFICNESLGFKNLSYPIKDKKTGFFHLFQYTSDKAKEIERRQKNIIYLFLCIYYDEIEHHK